MGIWLCFVVSLVRSSLLIGLLGRGDSVSRGMGEAAPSALGTELGSTCSEWQTRHLEASTSHLVFEALVSVKVAHFCITTPALELTAAAVRCLLPALFRQELGLCSFWLC